MLHSAAFTQSRISAMSKTCDMMRHAIYHQIYWMYDRDSELITASAVVTFDQHRLFFKVEYPCAYGRQ